MPHIVVITPELGECQHVHKQIADGFERFACVPQSVQIIWQLLDDIQQESDGAEWLSLPASVSSAVPSQLRDRIGRVSQIWSASPRILKTFR
jgi:hypothetical protein